MLLSGQLSDWSVADLLQMLHITKKTASLHIDGTDRSGAVYFDDGAIINAHVSLGAGGETGTPENVVEAVYVLQLLNDGSFDVRNEVPSLTVDALAVADALEQAGVHLTAERELDATGLLAARALRLAQVIEEPIILSEQVWRAISVSIPAFTFSELEQRLGRAGAVSTVEQFRELGILEAVLDEIEPLPPVEVHEVEHVEIDESGVEFDSADNVEPAEDNGSIEVAEDEIAPIVPDSDDRVGLITVDEDHNWEGGYDEAEEAPVAAGFSSLTAAIRAAAAVSEDEAAEDDESQLLAEAATDDDGSLRRTVRSLVGQE